MKIVVLLLFASAGASIAQYDPTLALNFVEENKDKKVANGICGDFVFIALKEAGFTAMYRPWSKYIWWGKRLAPRNVRPGDVIYFKRKRTVDHIGIVTEVVSHHEFYFADQNNGVRRLKDSRVGIHKLDTRKEKDKIIFYRPKYTFWQELADRLTMKRRLPTNENETFNLARKRDRNYAAYGRAHR